MTECKPLHVGDVFKNNLKDDVGYSHMAMISRMPGRGLHSFPFQLNMSSSVQRITQSNS